MLRDFLDLGVLESSISLQFSHAEFVFHSRIAFSIFLTFMYDVSGYEQLCSEFFSTSAVAVQRINENYWLCVTTCILMSSLQIKPK